MNTVAESKLRFIIQENLPDPILTFLDRRYWSDKAGQEYLDRLAFSDEADSLKITLGGSYFAACCFAAVCKQGLPLTSAFTDFKLGAEICRVRTSAGLHPSFAPH